MDETTSSPAPAPDAAQLPSEPSSPPPAVRRTRQASREAPAPDGPIASTEAPSGQTTDQAEAPKPQPWHAKLTKEEREAARLDLLREADPDEFTKVNDRYAGWNGKRLQVEKASADEANHQAYLRGLRDKAAQGDERAGVEYAQATASQEITGSHQRSWSEARQMHDSILANPVTATLIPDLGSARHASMAPRGSDGGALYGELAGGDGYLASLMYESDLARSMVKALPDWEKKIRADERSKAEREIKPAVERQVRSRVNLDDDDTPDIGHGASPGSNTLPKTLTAAAAWVKAMPLAEYQRRESEIDRHLATLNGRR